MIKKESRLKSLDLFRGLTVAAMILVNTPGDGDNVYPALEHSKWNGCTPTDLVFPCFLFMVGVSIVFALKNKRDDPHSHFKVLLGAFRRMIFIIAIGIGIQLFERFDFAHLRYPGVLQRIGVVYFISTFLYLKFNNRVLGYFFAFSLISYYIVMAFVSAPNGQLTNLEPATNMAAYIDRFVFTPIHMKKDTRLWDPLGLLSTLPAIASTLFGVGVGLWLNRTDIENRDKVIHLFVLATISIVAGLFWNLFFPINKPLWSSSYVLYSAGICLLGFTITYWYVDINPGGKYLWPLLVFGKNAISAYILSEIMPTFINMIKVNWNGTKTDGMSFLSLQIFSGILSPRNASLLGACCFVFFIWLLMYPLFRKNIYFKV